MKRLFYLIVAIVAASCAKENRFHVNGTISGAADTTLYLEHISLGDGIVAVDSVRLNGEGTFQLSGEAPQTPEFYRLRIGGQGINLHTLLRVILEAESKGSSPSISRENSIFPLFDTSGA